MFLSYGPTPQSSGGYLYQRFESIDKKFEQQTYDIISAFQGFANNTEERLQHLETTQDSIMTILDIIAKDVKDIKEDQLSWKSNYQRCPSHANKSLI